MKLAIKKPAVKAWIGLYREWAWSDKTQVTFKNWKEGQPDHATSTENCGAFYPSSGLWVDKSCEVKRKFFCTKGEDTQLYHCMFLIACKMPMFLLCGVFYITVTPKQTTLKIKIRSAADMNSKDVQQQISNQVSSAMTKDILKISE